MKNRIPEWYALVGIVGLAFLNFGGSAITGPEECTRFGQTEVDTSDSTLQRESKEAAKLLPSPVMVAGDGHFGRAVAIDGSLMVVGADVHVGDDQGRAVFIFQFDQGSGNWHLVTELARTNFGTPNGGFVGIFGDTVVVGAPNDNAGMGAAYIFQQDFGGANAWGQVAELTASDGEFGDSFGYAVDISGDCVVVGAPGDDDIDVDAGATYVFERDSGAANGWDVVKKITAYDGHRDDYFGKRVAIAENLLAVSAMDSVDGAVYLFNQDEGGTDFWGFVQKIIPLEGVSASLFGQVADVLPGRLIVGSRGALPWTPSTGLAFIFQQLDGGGEWELEATLVPPDGLDSDYFGTSVALGPEIAIVGSPFHDSGGENSGATYVFSIDQPSGHWSLQEKIAASDSEEDDHFGRAVALSGEVVVVAAVDEDTHGEDSGSVYVFDWNQGDTGSWGQVSKVSGPGWASTLAGEFGAAVSADRDMILVGMAYTGNDDIGGSHAVLFQRDQGDSGSWSVEKILVASDGIVGNEFGSAVSISGDTILIGANRDAQNGVASGSAYVFLRDFEGNDSWGEAVKLAPPDGGGFGYSVAIDGDTAVVGAPRDGELGVSAGAAYIFERNLGCPNCWGQSLKLTASDGQAEDLFGRTVSIDDNTIVVGALKSHVVLEFSGAAYVFERNDGGAGAWGQTAKLAPFEGTDEDNFGAAVSVSEDTVAVGARLAEYDGVAVGVVHIYQRDFGGDNAWGQTGKIFASDGQFGDIFGWPIEVLGDRMIVGAYRSSTGQSSRAGAAYIFRGQHNDNGYMVWEEVAKLAAFDGGYQDYFGRSVALSGGAYVIGAPRDDDLGEDSGSAYVFLPLPLFEDGFESGDAGAWSGYFP